MTDGDAAPVVTRLARAKLNLALHVTGRRPDGYHTLDSLVVFADLGDLVHAERASRLSLSLGGPFALDLSADDDNLVLRAARLMARPAALHLDKTLPVASGLGGGSADAAATLSALSALHDAPLPSPDAVLALGADVPVCLAGRPARMRGIGEDLSPVPALPPVWCVLVNPRTACPTPEIFARLERRTNPGLTLPPTFADAPDLAAWLATTRNDLEAPALSLVPAIGTALAALRGTPGCLIARMSGSGASVFALYAAEPRALDAATAIRTARPDWWTAAAPVARP